MLVHKPATRQTNCGQTCLSMLLNLPVERIEQEMGTTNGTRTRDLILMLQKYNFYVPRPHLKRCTWQSELPKLCILKVALVTFNYKKTHWILMKDRIVYDPAQPNQAYFNVFRNCLAGDNQGNGYYHLTSYLEIV